MQALKTYLTDHLAGAALAIRVLKALRAHHRGSELGSFANDLLREIVADEAVLDALNQRVPGNAGGWKRSVSRFFARLGARKFVGQKPAPFGAFEALEAIALGIQGKRALWVALREINEPRFAETDFEALSRRAVTQHAATEAMRLVLAKQAFID